MQSSSNVPSSGKRPRMQRAGMETIDMETTLVRLQMPTKLCNRFQEIFHCAMPCIRASKSSVKPHDLEQVFARTALLLAGSDCEDPMMPSVSTCPEPALHFTAMHAFAHQLLQHHGNFVIAQLCSEMQTNNMFDMDFDEYVGCIQQAMKGVDFVSHALEFLQSSVFTFTYSQASEQLQCDFNAICTLQQRLESAQCRMPQRDCSVLLATRFLQYHANSDVGELCLTRSALILSGSRPVHEQQHNSYTTQEQCDLAKAFIAQLSRFDPLLSDKLQDATRKVFNAQQPNLSDLYQYVKTIVDTSASCEEKKYRALLALKDVTAVLTSPPQHAAPAVKSLTLDDILDKINKLQLVCRRECSPPPVKRTHITLQKQSRRKKPKI